MRVFALLVSLVMAARADHETDVLARYGVKPDKASLGGYLRSLYPDETTLARIDGLVADLGSDRPRRRVEASRQLGAIGAAAIEGLVRGTRNPDPEVARGAARILERARAFLRPEVLYAAYATLSRRAISGLATEVVRTLPLVREHFVRVAARQALVTTATRSDLRRLRREVDLSGPVQAAAVQAVSRVLGDKARAELRGWLRHPNDVVKATAAWELANLRDNAGLDAFVELLTSHDLEARFIAWRALRGISSKRYGYAPYETEKARRPAIAAWRVWVRANKDTVTWSVPLRRRGRIRGRVLVAAAGENKVYELDATGKVVWTVAAQNPWCCAGTEDGHRIISHFDKNLVVEYDAAGVEVWRLKLAAQPCSLQRLANGNTLIAAGQKVTEYRPDQSVAWEADMPGRTFFARRLADGRTLVSLHDKGRIVEVTRGKVIRDRFKTLRGPYTVIPLENGNWLVCMPGSGRVAELNPAGEEVWAVAGLGWPASACRLENGATLIAHRGGVEEFRPGGARRFILRVKKGSVFLYRY